MERVARTRLLTIGVLVVVFGSGVSIGVAMDRSLGAQPPPEAAQAEEGPTGPTDDPNPRERPRRQAMWEQVEPSEEQRARIDSIVQGQQGDMRALQREFEAVYDPRYRALIVQTREAIKGVLTLEQARQYDSLIAEFDQRRSERGSRGGRD